MSSSLRNTLLVTILGLFIWVDLNAQTIKIMPLGNSITYDNNSFDESNPRPAADRISYRYFLYQLLKADGLDFDFVGSEDAGNAYFQNSNYDDNAGFPGVVSSQLATIISTGYNGYTKQYVSPGPYLNSYPADIILLHIGTNNLVTHANDVEDILDNIRLFDNDVIILVARIINRRSYHSATTTFNNNVELMVSARGDDKIKTVYIENGAGINYSTDMIDNLHPNQVGYNKMGQKWYEAIMALNQPPTITSIPPQNTDMGEAFDALSLDQYVSDPEDPDFLMVWNYELEQGSNLSVSIDASRVLHVTPGPGFSGSEIIKLKVLDSGSGAFPCSDSIEVVYRVNHINSAPVITSVPETSSNQGELYSYTVVANDVDGDNLQYFSLERPSWLSFNETSHSLSGIPEHADVGSHNIKVMVSDGIDSVVQAFTITVSDVNDPPSVVSSTELTVYEDEYMAHAIRVEDLDGDEMTVELLQKPDWLSYSYGGQTLYGMPDNDDVGIYDFIVKVSDGKVDIYEPHQITVINKNDPPEIISIPTETVGIEESYMYQFIATDIDVGDVLDYSAVHLPEWLSFTTSSTEGLLFGVPAASDRGEHLVILQVSDGRVQVLHAFTVNVTFPASIEDVDQGIPHQLYPNPASSYIRFEIGHTGDVLLRLTSATGAVLIEKSFEHGNFLEIDISDWPAGVYFYQILQKEEKSSGKFIKK